MASVYVFIVFLVAGSQSSLGLPSGQLENNTSPTLPVPGLNNTAQLLADSGKQSTSLWKVLEDTLGDLYSRYVDKLEPKTETVETSTLAIKLPEVDALQFTTTKLYTESASNDEFTQPDNKNPKISSTVQDKRNVDRDILQPSANFYPVSPALKRTLNEMQRSSIETNGHLEKVSKTQAVNTSSTALLRDTAPLTDIVIRKTAVNSSRSGNADPSVLLVPFILNVPLPEDAIKHHHVSPNSTGVSTILPTEATRPQKVTTLANVQKSSTDVTPDTGVTSNITYYWYANINVTELKTVNPSENSPATTTEAASTEKFDLVQHSTPIVFTNQSTTVNSSSHDLIMHQTTSTAVSNKSAVDNFSRDFLQQTTSTAVSNMSAVHNSSREFLQQTTSTTVSNMSATKNSSDDFPHQTTTHSNVRQQTEGDRSTSNETMATIGTEIPTKEASLEITPLIKSVLEIRRGLVGSLSEHPLSEIGLHPISKNVDSMSTRTEEAHTQRTTTRNFISHRILLDQSPFNFSGISDFSGYSSEMLDKAVNKFEYILRGLMEVVSNMNAAEMTEFIEQLSVLYQQFLLKQSARRSTTASEPSTHEPTTFTEPEGLDHFEKTFSKSSLCMPGNDSSDLTCISLVTNAATWNDAQRRCDELHGCLLILDSTQKKELLDTLLLTNNASSSLWVGYNGRHSDRFPSSNDNGSGLQESDLGSLLIDQEEKADASWPTTCVQYSAGSNMSYVNCRRVLPFACQWEVQQPL